MLQLSQIDDPQKFSVEDAEVEDVFHDGTVASTVEPTKPKWELKKLTTKHKRIVQAKVSGLQREDIAKLCNCTPEYVTMLMQQPLIQSLMKEHNSYIDQDLRDLTGSAVKVVRDMMDSPDDKVALTAATTVLRANGKLEPQGDGGKVTAEDVVAQLFAIHNSNVQINIQNKE
jgi:hypothetical protein